MHNINNLNKHLKRAFIEKIELNPFIKYKKYNILPLKEILHILCLLITTIQICVIMSHWTNYYIETQSSFCYFFYPSPQCSPNSCLESNNLIENECYLYTMNDTLNSANDLIDNYYNINKTAVGDYFYDETMNNEIKPVKVKIVTEYYEENDKNIEKNTFYLTPNYLGPLDPNQSLNEKEFFFQNLKKIYFIFYLNDWINGDYDASCYHWEIIIKYEMVTRGNIRVTSEKKIDDYCLKSDTKGSFIFWEIFLSILTFILSLIYIVLLIYDFYLSYILLYYAKYVLNKKKLNSKLNAEENAIHLPLSINNNNNNNNNNLNNQLPNFNELSIKLKAKLFDLWSILMIIACILSIISSFITFIQFPKLLPTNFRIYFLGLGCAAFWLNFISYLRYHHGLFSIMLILKRSSPRVFRLFIGSIPILIGYIFFSMIVFGDHAPRFGDFAKSGVTLFSVMNGDSIQETVNIASFLIPWIGDIFIISFYFIFVYVMLNIILSIVEGTLWEVHELDEKQKIHDKERFMITKSFGLPIKDEKDDLRDSFNHSSRRNRYTSFDALMETNPDLEFEDRLFLELLDIIQLHKDK